MTPTDGVHVVHGAGVGLPPCGDARAVRGEHFLSSLVHNYVLSSFAQVLLSKFHVKLLTLFLLGTR